MQRAPIIESLENRRLLSANALSEKGAKVTAVEGLTPPATFIVATLKDKTPEATSAYTVTINWGDGSSSAGSVVANQTGGFDVDGSHTYIARGKYHTTVAVTETDGNSAHARGLVTVQDAAITATGKNISGIAGLAFQGIVATYTNADPRSASGPVVGQTAIIRWGDHLSSPGTLALNSKNHDIEVSGKHTYAAAGTFAISILIREPTVVPTIATATATIAAPTPTTTPSLVGTYDGTAKEGGGGGLFDDLIGDAIGDQTFELVVTNQTIDNLSATITVAGASVTGDFPGSLLNNRKFNYVLSDTNGSITLSGRISADGSAISGQIQAKYAALESIKFKGEFSAKRP